MKLKIENFRELIKTQVGRLEVVNITHGIKLNNFQKNKTPIEIASRMINKTNLVGKDILVLFNLEFLEVLVINYGCDRVHFVADTALELCVAKKLYDVDGVLISEESFKNGNFIKEIQVMGKRFDLCFSNPPYNSNVDLRILSALEPLCEEMVVVHPSTWAIDLKGKSKLYNNFKKQIEGQVKSVEFFNGNPVFGIGLFVPCVITHIDKNHVGDISVNYFGDEFTVETLDDVTKFGNNWLTIVKPFFENMKRYCSQNGSVWDKNVFEIEEGKHYVQLAAIRGHVDLTGDGSKIVKDDFYTMVMENSEGNKGIREKFKRKDRWIVWQFDTENQQENFISYLKTDFSRFCLSIYKFNADIGYGTMELVPWLDFTQAWDDDKLFAHFGVNEETQNYIREFLPNFHGVRK